MTVLIIIGGLGWTVLVDIYRHHRIARLRLGAMPVEVPLVPKAETVSKSKSTKSIPGSVWQVESKLPPWR